MTSESVWAGEMCREVGMMRLQKVSVGVRRAQFAAAVGFHEAG